MRLDTHDVPRHVAADVSLCLYRILQEALANSAKHSGARDFDVHLWATRDELHLTVADRGRGFDVAAARVAPGIGLVSMQDRIGAVGGTLEVSSELGRGTTVRGVVPDCWPAAV